MRNRLQRFWDHFVEIFGYASRRKYAFQHSSWEVIKARQTGTTHTCLDFVVFRLFFLLILLAIGVKAVIETSATVFAVYFETWVYVVHFIYSCIFLRQVLADNRHMRALGTRQKMPERLIITDELERDGQKYYVSRRLSVLPTHELTIPEKLTWTLFNISVTMSIVSCFAQKNLLAILVREPGSQEYGFFSTYGIYFSFIDLFACTIPMSFGHAFHPILFTTLYFSVEHAYEVRSKVRVYVREAWVYPVWLELIGLIIAVHTGVVALAYLRDFIISLLDKSRAQSTQQRLRTQKRMARRKIMNEIRNEDGKLEKIVLEHLKYKYEDEDLVFWKQDQMEPQDIPDWTGGDSDDDVPFDPSSVIPVSNVTNAPPEYRYAEVEMLPPPPKQMKNEESRLSVISTGSRRSKLGDISEESIRLSRWEDELKNVRLPTPPLVPKVEKPVEVKPPPTVPVPVVPVIKQKEVTIALNGLDKNKPKKVGLNLNQKKISLKKPKLKPYPRIKSPPTPPEVPVNYIKPDSEAELLAMPRPVIRPRPRKHMVEIEEPIMKAMKKDYKSKALRSTMLQGRPKRLEEQHSKRISTSNIDPELQHEHREYLKHHHEHEIDRWVYHNQYIKEINEVQNVEVTLPQSQNLHQSSHTTFKHRGRNEGILKRNKSEGGDSTDDSYDDKAKPKNIGENMAQRRAARTRINPVYDPLGVPIVPSATATFHYLDAKLDRRGEEAKVPFENVGQYRHHPGIHIHHHGPGTGQAYSKPGAGGVGFKGRGNVSEEVESVVAFHPLIQYFDVPFGHEQQPSRKRRPTTVLLSEILGNSNPPNGKAKDGKNTEENK